jgi:NADH-quinone oxidoreductase subunit J
MAGLLATSGAGVELLSPVLILVLCVVAGVGTVLLLPGRREAVLRKIGGVILLAGGLIFAALLVHAVGNQGRGQMSVYFWLFSIIAIFGAIRVITHPRPVYSALYFVLTVLASAGLFILLWAEFMAAALILIYAGAILVTYVFVIMLASSAAPAGEATGPGAGGYGRAAGLADVDRVSRDPIAASAIGFALMGLLLFVIFDKAQGLPNPAPPPSAALAQTAVATMPPENAPGAVPTEAMAAATLGSTQSLGEYLFQSQLINLELAGIILTIAMIGAIVIARRRTLSHPGASATADVVLGPLTPENDNPHSIPVYGTDNPRQKAYPET